MDEGVQRLHKAIEDDGASDSGGCRAVIDIVSLTVDSGNVMDMLKIIARHELLNRMFWADIHGAPLTEEGWSQLAYVCSGGREMSDRLKEHQRRLVTVVRGAIGPTEVHRAKLFLPHRQD
jgi:hypothetical protein